MNTPAKPRERGIMFSTPMVRAILAGRKTQTRRVRCPYGAPCDRLWVRETWQHVDANPKDGGGKRVIYRASHAEVDGQGWRSPLLMPRWASRITLAVESIRVERAQDISDADIAAEGMDAEAVQSLWDDPKNRRRWGQVQLPGRFPGFDGRTPRELWSAAWTLINGRASWDANPWVWVIGFRSVETGDQP